MTTPPKAPSTPSPAGIAASGLATPDRWGPVGRGLALALAGSVLFSAKAIIVKLAYRYGVDAVTLIMYRMLFALPLFVALATSVWSSTAGAWKT